jgi:hypothetical protein
MTNNTLIFNVYTGEIYEVCVKDLAQLGPGYLPLTKQPRSNCKKCLGQSYLGKDARNNIFLACSCVQKNLNFDIIKSIENKSTELI